MRNFLAGLTNTLYLDELIMNAIKSVHLSQPNAHDFCVSPEALQENRSDKQWVQVPKKGEYRRQGIEICQIDYWGDEYCSLNTRFRPAKDVYGYIAPPSQSCTKVRQEDPEKFESERSVIEAHPWTLTEMRKALKWIFNCTGKIPVKICAPVKN
jgi:hypothetical protein